VSHEAIVGFGAGPSQDTKYITRISRIRSLRMHEIMSE